MPNSPDPYIQGGNLLLDDIAMGDPTFQGNERYVSGAFRRRDAVGVYDPRTVWRAAHDGAVDLAHLVETWAGGPCYINIVGAPLPSARQYFTDYNMTTLLAQISYTRNAVGQVTQQVTQVFAADGVTVTAQSTDAFTYSGQYCTAIRRS